jgi:hypothetical protein
MRELRAICGSLEGGIPASRRSAAPVAAAAAVPPAPDLPPGPAAARPADVSFTRALAGREGAAAVQEDPGPGKPSSREGPAQAHAPREAPPARFASSLACVLAGCECSPAPADPSADGRAEPAQAEESRGEAARGTPLRRRRYRNLVLQMGHLLAAGKA